MDCEQRGLTVLRAAGAPLERDFGYGIVRQLLERMLRSLDAVSRERVLGGAAAAAAPVLGLPAASRGSVTGAHTAYVFRAYARARMGRLADAEADAELTLQSGTATPASIALDGARA